MTNDEILAAAEMIFAARLREPEAVFHDRAADGDRRGPGRDPRPDAAAARHHADARTPRGHIGRIVGSVNPLVPKPGTAYQWLPMENDRVIERKIKRMRTLMAGIDNVYFNIKSERHSFYQALLSLGDRRVAPAIEAAERNGGNWRAAVAEAGVDADFFVFRDRSDDAVLPWDIIDGGMKAAFFRTEFDKATARGVDAAAEAAEGERAAPPGAAVASASRGFRLKAEATRLYEATAAFSSYSAYACRISSRSRSCAVASPLVGRSSAKLRRSPFTVY